MERRARKMVSRMEELMPLIRESLEAGQSVRFFPRGVSMLPMLRQDVDSVVLSPITGELKKYDIPLYQRDNGQYVLHRIIDVGTAYTCRGDNQFIPEPGLRRDQMIGVVTAFYRGDRLIPVESARYRFYCRFWYYTRPLHGFLRRVRQKLRRLIR